MESFTAIVARGNIILRRDTESTPSTTSSLPTGTMDLLIALMTLIFIALCLIGALYVVRKIRRSRAIARQALPQYETASPNIHKHTRSNSRRLTISTSGGYGTKRSSVYVYDEKSPMMSARDKEMGGSSGESSPVDVPEIRITFPDEHDDSGRRKSGRVVVVRVTDTGVGLEPLEEPEEQLPAYEKEMGGRFHSIDMERIGGLKEKSEWS